MVTVNEMYYTYVLRCENNSLYTGITTDVSRRMSEHFGKKTVGARYTKSHTPKALEAVWECGDRSAALRFEARIKKLPKAKKELLVSENRTELLGDGFEGIKRIDLRKFERFVD